MRAVASTVLCSTSRTGVTGVKALDVAVTTQETVSQNEVGHHGHALSNSHHGHIAFDNVTAQQRVFQRNGFKAGQATACRNASLEETIRTEVGCSKRSNLARLHQCLHCRKTFLKGHVRIFSVEVEQIDVVRLKSLE